MTCFDIPPRQAEPLLHVLHCIHRTRHITKRCGIARRVADNISNGIRNIILQPAHCIYCTSCLLVCNTTKLSSHLTELRLLQTYSILLEQSQQSVAGAGTRDRDRDEGPDVAEALLQLVQDKQVDSCVTL